MKPITQDKFEKWIFKKVLKLEKETVPYGYYIVIELPKYISKRGIGFMNFTNSYINKEVEEFIYNKMNIKTIFSYNGYNFLLK